MSAHFDSLAQIALHDPRVADALEKIAEVATKSWSDNPAIIIALSALFISVAGLIWQSISNIKSSLPFLSYFIHMDDKLGPDTGVIIKNDGLGPAKIISIRFFLCGEELTGSKMSIEDKYNAYLNRELRNLYSRRRSALVLDRHSTPSIRTTIHFQKSIVGLYVGKQYTIFGVDFINMDGYLNHIGSYTEEIEKFISDKVFIYVTYKSIYGLVNFTYNDLAEYSSIPDGVRAMDVSVFSCK